MAVEKAALEQQIEVLQEKLKSMQGNIVCCTDCFHSVYSGLIPLSHTCARNYVNTDL